MEGIVATRGGVVVARATGRGIGPALKLYREGSLRGADVADKIVGKAAAALFVAGGAVSVRADVMCESAAELLAAYAIPSGAAAVVPAIVNRAGTGLCPMEAAVRDLDDPAAMVVAIERTYRSLTSGAAASESNMI